MAFLLRVFSGSRRELPPDVKRLSEEFSRSKDELSSALAENANVRAFIEMIFETSDLETQIFLSSPSRSLLKAKEELICRLFSGLSSQGLTLFGRVHGVIEEHGVEAVADIVLHVFKLVSNLLVNKHIGLVDNLSESLDYGWQLGSPLSRKGTFRYGQSSLAASTVKDDEGEKDTLGARYMDETGPEKEFIKPDFSVQDSEKKLEEEDLDVEIQGSELETEVMRLEAPKAVVSTSEVYGDESSRVHSRHMSYGGSEAYTTDSEDDSLSSSSRISLLVAVSEAEESDSSSDDDSDVQVDGSSHGLEAEHIKDKLLIRSEVEESDCSSEDDSNAHADGSPNDPEAEHTEDKLPICSELQESACSSEDDLNAHADGSSNNLEAEHTQDKLPICSEAQESSFSSEDYLIAPVGGSSNDLEAEHTKDKLPICSQAQESDSSSEDDSNAQVDGSSNDLEAEHAADKLPVSSEEQESDSSSEDVLHAQADESSSDHEAEHTEDKLQICSVAQESDCSKEDDSDIQVDGSLKAEEHKLPICSEAQESDSSREVGSDVQVDGIKAEHAEDKLPICSSEAQKSESSSENESYVQAGGGSNGLEADRPSICSTLHENGPSTENESFYTPEMWTYSDKDTSEFVTGTKVKNVEDDGSDVVRDWEQQNEILDVVKVVIEESYTDKFVSVSFQPASPLRDLESLAFHSSSLSDREENAHSLKPPAAANESYVEEQEDVKFQVGSLDRKDQASVMDSSEGRNDVENRTQEKVADSFEAPRREVDMNESEKVESLVEEDSRKEERECWCSGDSYGETDMKRLSEFRESTEKSEVAATTTKDLSGLRCYEETEALVIPHSGVIVPVEQSSYSPPLRSLSLRSESSTTSARSFAFPILSSDWTSSPVKMAPPERKYIRHAKQSWSRSLCCFCASE